LKQGSRGRALDAPIADQAGNPPLDSPALSTTFLKALAGLYPLIDHGADAAYARLMPQRRFPRAWRLEPIPGGYRVIDANGLGLAHVYYGEPPNAIAVSDKRLTGNGAEKIARLIARLPELV
jgi:hypothetical protein